MSHLLNEHFPSELREVRNGDYSPISYSAASGADGESCPPTPPSNLGKGQSGSATTGGDKDSNQWTGSDTNTRADKTGGGRSGSVSGGGKDGNANDSGSGKNR